MLRNGKMKPYSYGLLAIGSLNPQLHSLRTIASNQGLISLYEMACVFKARINAKSNRPCNLKEIDRFLNRVNYTRSNVGTKVELPTS